MSHRLLFKKLEAYGVRGCLLSWIRDFLIDRTFSVKIDDTFSVPLSICSGVPQGSVIGPLLFLIFINDLPSALPFGVSCFLYADDVKIFASNDASLLQCAVSKLYEWSVKWDLPIASDKTQLLRLGRNNPRPPIYTHENCQIPNCRTTRDLGIIISESLRFSEHIDSIVGRANSRVNLLLRNFDIRDTSKMIRLFKVYVRPILEYAT